MPVDKFIIAGIEFADANFRLPESFWGHNPHPATAARQAQTLPNILLPGEAAVAAVATQQRSPVFSSPAGEPPLPRLQAQRRPPQQSAAQPVDSLATSQYVGTLLPPITAGELLHNRGNDGASGGGGEGRTPLSTETSTAGMIGTAQHRSKEESATARRRSCRKQSVPASLEGFELEGTVARSKRVAQVGSSSQRLT